MFPFPKSVAPAVQSHLDSQVAFFNDLSKSMCNSMQSIFQANLQLGQTMLEESVATGQRLLTADHPADSVSAVASSAQPAADKLLAYKRHISRIAADSQVELARVVEQHVPQTSRSAQDLAEQVKRTAAEETDRHLRQQEETLKNFRDPFQQEGNANRTGGVHQVSENRNTWADQAGTSMQSDSQASQSSARETVKSQSAAQSGNRTSGKSS